MGWQEMLLSKMRAPANSFTISSLTQWAESEGMPSRYNNWLATTYSGFGGWDVNSAGVKAYPSVAAGVNATWATLSEPAYIYVVNAFRGGRDKKLIYTAINESPWCRGCQSGHYPVALYEALGGKTIPTGGGVATAPMPQYGSGGRRATPAVLARINADNNHISRTLIPWMVWVKDAWNRVM